MGPERDRNTAPEGLKAQLQGHPAQAGLGSPNPGNCQKLGMGSWKLGWCGAQAWQLQQMVARAPQSPPSTQGSKRARHWKKLLAERHFPPHSVYGTVR